MPSARWHAANTGQDNRETRGRRGRQREGAALPQRMPGDGTGAEGGAGGGAGRRDAMSRIDARRLREQFGDGKVSAGPSTRHRWDGRRRL